jgi:tetratricopeptide (TPR) repeat protein
MQMLRANDIKAIAAALTLVWGRSVSAQGPAAATPDELYRHRDNLASARRAADLWAARAETAFEPAWKLSRVSYWLGTQSPASERRAALERGVRAGETAVRLAPDRPEGHFWLAANLGELAESGAMQGLKYRGRIRDELERVRAIQPGWQGGSAEAALGQWYFEVPGLLGGSHKKAEELLRRALTYDPENRAALSFLAEVLASGGRREDARALLRRVIDAPDDPEWMPENNDFKKKAMARLRTLGGA